MNRMIVIILGLALLAGCHQKIEVETFSGRTMGTSYNVKYLSLPGLIDKDVLKKEVDQLLVKINKQMSTYIEDSELSLINYNYKTGPYELSDELFFVIKHSLSIALKTEGAFDPTLGPLVNLWGFGPDGKRKVPTQEKLQKAMKRVGYTKVTLNKPLKELYKSDSELYIDLSASAKGYGVDEVAKVLETRGISNYMVEIGGEVKTGGTKTGRNWRIAIESPNPAKSEGRYQRVLSLSGQALATSGDYRNNFTEKGKKYSHTIDFRTGKPVDHTLASVSVLDKESCMNADAWATALMALGPIEGLKFAEENAIAAYFIYRLKGEEKFQAKETSHFKKLAK